MKVLHLCVKSALSNGFGGGVGGYSTYTQRLNELEVDFQANDIENYYLGVTHPWGWKIRSAELFFRFIIDTIACFVKLLVIRPDIVHIHGLYWRSAYRELCFALMAKTVGAKIFYEARAGNLIDCLKTGPVYRQPLSIIFKISSLITMQGSTDLEELRSFIPTGRIGVAPNYLSKKFEAAQKIDFTRNTKSVAFVGAVGFRKKCDKILHIARLKPDFQFHLFGSVESDFLKLSVPANVILHGRTEHEHLIPKLAESSYFLFLSSMPGEGQPNALIEAISLGLRPITINKGYIREVVPSHFPIFSGNIENITELLVFFEQSVALPASSTYLQAYRDERSSDQQLHSLVNMYQEIICST